MLLVVVTPVGQKEMACGACGERRVKEDIEGEKREGWETTCCDSESPTCQRLLKNLKSCTILQLLRVLERSSSLLNV